MTVANAEARLTEIIERMAPLPEVATQVLAITNEPDFDLSRLVDVVRTDPALTARILKLCNSSLFSLSRDVRTIPEALGYIGTRNLVRIVITTSSGAVFKRGPGQGAVFRPRSLWQNSMACAVAAQLTAECANFAEPATAFTAGVLHNVGRVALAELFSSETIDVPREVEAAGGDYLRFERNLGTTDHTELADRVTQRWQVPPELRRALRLHHENEAIAREGGLVAILSVADGVAHTIGVGVPHEALELPDNAVAAEVLALTENDVAGIRARTIDEIERLEELIKFSGS